jgi:hypothetical protein
MRYEARRESWKRTFSPEYFLSYCCTVIFFIEKSIFKPIYIIIEIKYS